MIGACPHFSSAPPFYAAPIDGYGESARRPGTAPDDSPTRPNAVDFRAMPIPGSYDGNNPSDHSSPLRIDPQATFPPRPPILRGTK